MNETSAQAYARLHREVDGLLKQLSSLLEVHKIGHENRPTHWGFVGDLGHASEKLRELVEFLDSSESVSEPAAAVRFAIRESDGSGGWAEPRFYDLDEMLEGNVDDELFCDWLRAATPGCVEYPAIGTQVECLAAEP